MSEIIDVEVKFCRFEFAVALTWAELVLVAGALVDSKVSEVRVDIRTICASVGILS